MSRSATLLMTPSLLVFRFAVVAVFCLSATAYGGDIRLLGCWKSDYIVQFFPDGTSAKNRPTACVLQFESDRIKSGCGEIGYTYRVLRPGVYSAAIVTHSNRPDLIGATREYEYRVEGGHLFITTYPQTTTPSPPTKAIRVESKSSKVICP
jgi:hypothetical protein